MNKLEPIVPTKHKTPKAVAKALIKLYRDPRRHSQHAYMRGVSGRSVNREGSAVSCCVLGGISLFMEQKADGQRDRDAEAVMDAFDRAAAKLYYSSPVFVNDTLGVEGVRKVLQEVLVS